ncbi:MAG: tyrosine-type recombinase/integrase [Pyrinomonadaceae bacterium]|nr:tyrosine-type recombinase/integrase [Pyrinomonadaceae bacterium]
MDTSSPPHTPQALLKAERLTLAAVPLLDPQSVCRFAYKSNSDGTKQAYLRALREFFRGVGDLHPSLVTTEMVLGWRDQMAEAHLRPATISTKLAILRSYFEYLRAGGELASNPAATRLVPPPRLPEESPGRALSSKEVRYLLAGPDRREATGARDYALMMLMLRTSIRVSEAVGLRVSVFQRAGDGWTFKVKVKGGRERTLPLPPDVKAVIDEYLRLDRANRDSSGTGGPGAYLFQPSVNRRSFKLDKPLSTRHVWHLFAKWGLYTGVGRVTPHDLRRTAITRALSLGHDPRRVQMMSGHKNLNSLRPYDRARENMELNPINDLHYDET